MIFFFWTKIFFVNNKVVCVKKNYVEVKLN